MDIDGGMKEGRKIQRGTEEYEEEQVNEKQKVSLFFFHLQQPFFQTNY